MLLRRTRECRRPRRSTSRRAWRWSTSRIRTGPGKLWTGPSVSSAWPGGHCGPPGLVTYSILLYLYFKIKYVYESYQKLYLLSLFSSCLRYNVCLFSCHDVIFTFVYICQNNQIIHTKTYLMSFVYRIFITQSKRIIKTTFLIFPICSFHYPKLNFSVTTI